MKLSLFGEKFSSKSGINSLMDDLGNAMSGNSNAIMMGGGNPAHIPEIQNYFKDRLTSIINTEKDFQRLIGIYDPPQGNVEFISSLCTLLNDEFGWGISHRNIALSNGSQSAFFMLFNLLAGKFSDGIEKQIQLPLAPEYIGYSDAGLIDNFFSATKPHIRETQSHEFKYHIDFSSFRVGEKSGAICVSRPTNPTGNVLTDQEVEKLGKIAKDNDIPLIVDAAYGTPFPNLIYTEARPFWNENTILCLSLSKFGLPAARTGIIVADEKVIQAVSGVNAIMNLATGSFGSLVANDLVKSKKVISLSNDIIKPFYYDRAQKARDLLEIALKGLPYKIHKIEGAMFLWLWLCDCPVTSQELYERLKDKGVLVVSGHHFFPGLNDAWQHKNECLRISYTQEEFKVKKGIEIIGQVVREAYHQ